MKVDNRVKKDQAAENNNRFAGRLVNEIHRKINYVFLLNSI